MIKDIKIMRTFTLKSILAILVFIPVAGIYAQSNGDKLFLEGQSLQKIQTISAQNQAIKKFQAAKVVYTASEKKKMCDNQISICNNNLISIKKNERRSPKKPVHTERVQEKLLILSSNRIDFSGEKNGTYSLDVKAPSMDWSFEFLENVGEEQNFVRANRSNDAKSIDIEVDANPLTIERHKSLKVTYNDISDTVCISQSGKEVILSTDKNLVEFKLKGGVKTIELYTNSDSTINTNNGLTWYVKEKPDWIETNVKVKKKKGLFGKGISKIKGLLSGTAIAAMAEDVKESDVNIEARPLTKMDAEYLTGRRGEIVFASQDKIYKITVLQQK